MRNILDNDFYKLTMGQLVYHNFQNVEVEYKLFIRDNVDLRPYKENIEREINDLQTLIMNRDEKDYLNSIRFLTKDYINWFSNYRFRPEDHVFISEKNNNLDITIRGNWADVIYYEVPILAIISEVYYKKHSELGSNSLLRFNNNLNNKISLINDCPNFKFIDFGTRRRFSYMIHDTLVERLSRELPNNFIGTSNVHLAMKYGVKAIGTHAHEIIQCSQSLFPLPIHQKEMLRLWSKEFNGDLGIALSDTLGIDYFLKDFTLDLAKQFDGVRQDSGDPYLVANKVIQHYKKLGINPKSKTIVFSDGLNIKKAILLYRKFNDIINVSFGIGTNLTNDCGQKPLQIVIKVQECNGIPVCKISDSGGKEVCKNKHYLEFMKDFIRK